MSTILHETMNCYQTIAEICITTQQLLHRFMHKKHQISSKESSTSDIGNSKCNLKPYLIH